MLEICWKAARFDKQRGIISRCESGGGLGRELKLPMTGFLIVEAKF